jgi:hypothetical protein
MSPTVSAELAAVQQALAGLQAKQDLHELTARYCIGVDRRDRALLESLWWPESEIDFGLFKGSGAQFAEIISAPNPALEITYHFAGNELFELDGDRASGRSYVLGVSVVLGEDGRKTDQLVGGRYLDQYERRGSVWKFTRRLFVVDWMNSQPDNARWDTGIGALASRGRAGLDDVSCTFFKS